MGLGGPAKGGFDRKRSSWFDVVEDEALTLFRYGPAHIARDCPIAAEDLSTPAIGFERRIRLGEHVGWKVA
jgi:hypothetical protein